MDVTGILKALQKEKPPLECPVCQKVYRSFSGVSYHVVKYHSGGHNQTNFISSEEALTPFFTKDTVRKKPLSYAEAQRMVEFDFSGHIYRELISSPMPLEVEHPGTEEDEADANDSSSEKPAQTTKTPARGTPKKRGKGRLRLVHYKQRHYHMLKKALNRNEENKPQLPVAVYNILPEEEIINKDIEERTSYYRYIDKSSEELDEAVEYGMDEEDYIWLETVNSDRKNANLAPISKDVFETLMDRLEKESHFETRTVTGDPYNLIDEDAVCSICCDGECSNSNGILFCDMCNLAVHQECYGVPYIPEGQWLCRKCLQSPSKPVNCELCPTKSGAFKQTDTNKWAHVVCALWIPEVCFANTVFLEPIDSIGNIPAARWKLVCYICKQKTGACIQCFKTNCYTAFHVTCAQQGGLHMKIEAGRLENGQPTVKKSAYCDAHTPKNTNNEFGTPSHSECGSDEDSDTGSVNSKTSTMSKSKAYQTPTAKLKEVQKKLLEKKTFKLPAVHIPFVPAHRLSKIVSNVAIAKKSQFIQQLQSYWMLKRQSRNGVPLLRRLQANTGTGINRNQQKEHTLEEWSQSQELKEQLRYWQQLRHDLERARLLIELIRKREKIKKEQCLMKQQIIEMQLKPLQLEMERTIELLQERDTTGIFAEPVKLEEAPDYHEFISNPMDFSTMRQKLADYEYVNFDLFETDFNLIIRNCLDFNQEDTVFYRAALRMRSHCRPILKLARKRIRQAGIDPETGMHMAKPQLIDVDCGSPTEDDVSALLKNPFMSIDEKLEDLEMKLEISDTIKNALTRLARQKTLRKEIAKLKRQKRKLDHPNNSSTEPESSRVVDGTEDVNLLVRRKKHRKRYNGDVKIPPSEENITLSHDENGENNVFVNKDNETGDESDGATISIIKLKTPTKLSAPTSLNLDPSESFTSQVKSPLNGASPERLLPIILEPAKVVRNPSPGRNRRSGILFKKKQYQPVKPSPLVIYSSTTTSDDGNPKSPIKLHLKLKENSDLKIRSENDDPNARTYVNLDFRKRISPTKRENTIHLSDHISTVNGHTKFNGNLETPKFDGCENESTLPQKRTRKRTYTSSSDSDGNATKENKRKVHRRGRQRSARLSFEDEFGNLDGLSDIKCGIYMVNSDETHLRDPKSHPETIDFIKLIWAKCKGYPSYPAMTIDPDMPRTGYQSNGVPIPIPPLDVLQMNDNKENYLILFFDARRTWQWLPRDKIEPLGIDSRLDEHKLIESKKPAKRKNVQEAYKRAIAFRHRLEVGENSEGEMLDDSNENDELDSDDSDGVEDNDADTTEYDGLTEREYETETINNSKFTEHNTVVLAT